MGQLFPPGTLVHSMHEAVARHPGRGLSILSKARHAERHSYTEVLNAAAVFAGRWAALGVTPRTPVIIALPTSWGLVHAWLGAIFCGALPLITASIQPFGNLLLASSRLEQLSSALGARYILCSAALRDRSPLLATKMITPEDLARTPPARVHAAVKSSETAFLQMTSGTSGTPRVVEISHRAVVLNTSSLYAAVAAGRDRKIDAVVSWLPLHHDMGLVGAFLLSLVTGCELCLLPPKLFLASPQIWHTEIASRHSVLTLSPNFGLQLCVERDSRQALPGALANLQATVCGGEMLRHQTLCSYADLYGVPPEVLCPGYGLAEATLAVTIDHSRSGPRTRPAPAHTKRRFQMENVVCLGQPLLDTELRIVRPDGNTVPQGHEGEVLVSGASIFSGYFRDAEATRQVLRSGWLHTGDLGFLHDGNLYISGRLSDRLVIKGMNVAPHELEWVAEAASGGGGGCRAAAFSTAIDARGEQAILVIETMERNPRSLAAIERAIRSRIGEAMALQIADVVWVRRGRLPRTSSGKIRRTAARLLYEQGQLASQTMDFNLAET